MYYYVDNTGLPRASAIKFAALAQANAIVDADCHCIAGDPNSDKRFALTRLTVC